LLLKRSIHKPFFGALRACFSFCRSRSRALDVPLIPEASKAFTLQLQVLPHELFDPLLRLQPIPTLTLELV
jgi:hypothetical protein